MALYIFKIVLFISCKTLHMIYRRTILNTFSTLEDNGTVVLSNISTVQFSKSPPILETFIKCSYYLLIISRLKLCIDGAGSINSVVQCYKIIDLLESKIKTIIIYRIKLLIIMVLID